MSNKSSWVPIESNPEVMNKFLSRLGVPEKWRIVDVLSLDKDMLGLIPRPTLAMILLFPTSEKYDQLQAKQEALVKKKRQEFAASLYFLKQIISNSCGTVALIHAVANNQQQLQLGDGFLKQFLEDTKRKDPEERGQALAQNQGFINAHAEIATEGQSQLPTDDNPVIHHFATFVCCCGSLYELDGRKSTPIYHGNTSPATFVEDAAKVITEIMKIEPDEMRFTVCALSAKMD